MNTCLFRWAYSHHTCHCLIPNKLGLLNVQCASMAWSAKNSLIGITGTQMTRYKGQTQTCCFKKKSERTHWENTKAFSEIYWTPWAFPPSSTLVHTATAAVSATSLVSWRSHIQSSAHINAAPNIRDKTLMTTSSHELKNNPTFRCTHSWRRYSRDAQLGLKHTSKLGQR